MTTCARAVFRLLAVLPATFVLAPILAAGEDDPFVRAPRLAAVLRINHALETDRKCDAALRDLNSNTALRTPVQLLAGPFLRNPSLRELDADSFLEFLRFRPEGDSGEVAVAAFRAKDPVAYRAFLLTQPGLRETGTTDDVTALREETRAAVTPLFLSILPTRAVLFGPDRTTVRLARELYLRCDAEGLLRDAQADVTVRLVVSRFLAPGGDASDLALDRIREDLARDWLGPAASARHPLSLILGQGVRSGRNLLRQFDRVELAASLDPEALVAALRITPAENSLAAQVALQAPPGELTLAAFLPASAVSFQDVLLWPELWGEILKGAGGILEAAFGSVAARSAGAALRDFLDRIATAKPEEILSATLVSPSGRVSGPFRAKVIRWGRPDKLPELDENLNVLLRTGPVAELLTQNGIELELRRESTAFRAGNAPVERRSWRLKLGGGADAFSRGRTFLVARAGSRLALVVGPETGVAVDVERDEVAILDALLSTPPPVVTGGSLAAVRPETAFGTAAVFPMDYVRLALEAAADPARPATAGELLSPEARDAAAFARIPAPRVPITLSVSARGADLRTVLRAPRPALQALLRACLGVETRVGE